MRSSYVTALIVSVVLLLASSSLSAQTATGQVNGNITDGTGAVVGGANITITNQGTKITNRTTSNTSGNFLFINLQPGVYSLEVEKQGFKKAEIPPFELAVNQTISQPVALSVGAATETVEVTAVAPMLQVASSELGTVIPERAVTDLPLNGRNFTFLAQLGDPSWRS
jgi:hypothetical protein